jgi:hypothetical protein
MFLGGTPHGTLCIYSTTFTYHISPTCHTCRSRKMPNASGHILYRNLIARNMRNVVGVYICITSKAFLACKTYMHNTYSTPKQSFKNPWACTGTTCSYTKCFTHSKDTYCFLPHILWAKRLMQIEWAEALPSLFEFVHTAWGGYQRLFASENGWWLISWVRHPWILCCPF